MHKLVAHDKIKTNQVIATVSLLPVLLLLMLRTQTMYFLHTEVAKKYTSMLAKMPPTKASDAMGCLMGLVNTFSLILSIAVRFDVERVKVMVRCLYVPVHPNRMFEFTKATGVTGSDTELARSGVRKVRCMRVSLSLMNDMDMVSCTAPMVMLLKVSLFMVSVMVMPSCTAAMGIGLKEIERTVYGKGLVRDITSSNNVCYVESDHSIFLA